MDSTFEALERHNYPKLVVSVDDVSFGTRNGIHHHLAWDLLSKTGRFPA